MMAAPPGMFNHEATSRPINDPVTPKIAEPNIMGLKFPENKKAVF